MLTTLLTLTPRASSSQPARAAKPLEVRIEAGKESFEEGEPIAIRVWIVNVSDKDVYLFRTLYPEGQMVLFTIRDEHNAEIYRSPRIMMERTAAFVEDTILLAPGYSWGAVFQLGRTTTSQKALHLPAGKYQARAIYANHDADGKGGTLTGTFPSNPLEIRVVKPKAMNK